MKSYTQLTQKQRYHIYYRMKTGCTITKIALELGVHKSTVSREIKRNLGKRGYRPQQAHRFALFRRLARAALRISAGTWELVESLIRLDLSPEQVSGRLERDYGLTVSHEWIYQYVYADKRSGGDLHTHLRCRKKRRKCYGKYSRRGLIPGRVGIEQRPAVVDFRKRIGDWEADTIIGKGHKQAIVSLTERRSRLTLIKKVSHKTADAVRDAIVELLAPLKRYVRTITSDNGTEFAAHKDIAKKLKTNFYFARPYHAWERGANENANGLIRQYFPKGHDFKTITEEQINFVMERLNNRPRKTLGFKTPNEVFYKLKPVALAT